MGNKEHELAVCEKWVELYNKRYNTDLVKPVPSAKDPPDCITRSKSNPEDIYNLEATAAAPDERKGLGKNQEYEVVFDDTDLDQRLSQTYEVLKRKKDKYTDPNKRASLTILLHSEIEYDDEDLPHLVEGASTNLWQTKFAELGFRQIWCITPNETYKFFPIL